MPQHRCGLCIDSTTLLERGFRECLLVSIQLHTLYGMHGTCAFGTRGSLGAAPVVYVLQDVPAYLASSSFPSYHNHAAATAPCAPQLHWRLVRDEACCSR